MRLISRSEKRRLVWKLDIVKEVSLSNNLVGQPVARDHSFPHVGRWKRLFNVYHVRIDVEVCNDFRVIPYLSELVDAQTFVASEQKSLWVHKYSVMSSLISIVQSVIFCYYPYN